MGTDDLQLLINKIKELCSELGRMPTRDEFLTLSGVSRKKIDLNGGYTQLKILSGVESKLSTNEIKYKPRIIKSNELFYKPIEQVIDEHTRVKRYVDNVEYPILVIPDTHHPFSDVDSLTLMYEWIEKNKPKTVVSLGDLLDLYSFSKFPRSLNYYSPREELELGLKMAKSMWETVNKLTKARCFQILGNHDFRPMKKIIELAPEFESLIDFYKFFQFDNVLTFEDPRMELILNDILFTHGHLSKIGQHRDYYLMNCCTGHSHHAGVSYRNLGNKILWELNAGYLGDPTAKALSYTPKISVNWTRGWGVIDANGPRFISI